LAAPKVQAPESVVSGSGLSMDFAFDADAADSSLPPALGGTPQTISETPRLASEAPPARVPHPAASARPDVPQATASPADSSALPAPQEPDAEGFDDVVVPLTESDLSSLKPVVGEVPESTFTGGLSADDLELPSPTADFDKQLSLASAPDEPGDFGADFGLPEPDGRLERPRSSVERSSASALQIEAVESFDPASLPDLPDLDSGPSRGSAAATVVDGPSIEALEGLGDDMFTLDSQPPDADRIAQARALTSDASDDDGFLDDDFSTGSSLGGFSAPPSVEVSMSSTGSSAKSSSDSGEEFDASAYGRINFGGGDGGGDAGLEVGSSFESDDGEEFGAIPQETGNERPASGHQTFDADVPPPPTPDRRDSEPSQPTDPAKSKTQRAGGSKAGKVALALALLSLTGGGALALLPNVGPFGFHLISDLLNRDTHEQLLRRTAERVIELRDADDFVAVNAVQALSESARRDAPRFEPLAAYSALTHYSLVVRFGGLSKVQATAKVLLDELIAGGVESDVAYFTHAQAAQSLLNGDYGGAERALDRATGDSVEKHALLGELGLISGQPEQALSAWTNAIAKRESAWTLFGLARTHHAAGRLDEATTISSAVLQKNPEHVGAKLMLAQIARTNNDEPAATSNIDSVLEKPAAASPLQRVLAHTLLGEIHLERGRLSKAEGEFTLALEDDPKAIRASVGLGDTLFAAGRFAAALARYEVVARDKDTPLSATLGVVKTQLALDRVEQARLVLAPLLTSHAKQPDVAFWTGKLAAASGQREQAEAAFRGAIEHGGTAPVAVNAYVALAQSLSQAGELGEAQTQLSEAQRKFPKSVLLRNSLGQVALSQGRYEAALVEFRAAKKLDPTDVTAVFNEGSALRRLRRFEDAWKVFARVAEMDKELPGLPLERGLLLEQSGKSDEALKEYELALSKDPKDPDLQVRVGCGRVAVGQGRPAEEILTEVLKRRARVAEVHHCLGRALFLQERHMEALKRLQEASDLDPTRAEYHMYVGWVANEAGQVALAKRVLNVALELDQGLADAYWQRGVLSLRQGGPGDAIVDFKQALKLRPSRFEAHADLAQAYYQMGRLREAAAHWQQALAADGENPTWLFRYGKLLHSQHRDADAASHLERAITAGSKTSSPPGWLWEAHHLAAASLRGNPRALEHWKQFLKLGPEDSPYRVDAKRALREAGQPWHGR
jgi:tetratricopeptide (TPR) repeat protein